MPCFNDDYWSPSFSFFLTRLLVMTLLCQGTCMKLNYSYHFWKIRLLKVCWLTLFYLNVLSGAFPYLNLSSYWNWFCTASSQKDVDGILVFRGSVCSFAYLNSKEPISQAVTEIKVTFILLSFMSFSFILEVLSCLVNLSHKVLHSLIFQGLLCDELTSDCQLKFLQLSAMSMIFLVYFEKCFTTISYG